MDKKTMEKLMQKRNPITRETVKPVDFFNSQPAKQQNSKPAKQQNKLIKYTTYLLEDEITKIKIKAVTEKKKDYEVVQEALDKFFGKI